MSDILDRRGHTIKHGDLDAFDTYYFTYVIITQCKYFLHCKASTYRNTPCMVWNLDSKSLEKL